MDEPRTLNANGCKSSERRDTVRSTVDGSSEGMTFAESLACRQQLIGSPQAIASDILVVLVCPELERNIELDNNAPQVSHRAKRGQGG